MVNPIWTSHFFMLFDNIKIVSLIIRSVLEYSKRVNVGGKQMKKLLSLLVVCLMVLSLSACGSKEENNKASASPETTDASETVSPANPDTNNDEVVYDFSEVYKNETIYYSVGLGTSSQACQFTIPESYVLTSASVVKDGVSSELTLTEGNTFVEDIENGEFDTLALYDGLNFKSADDVVSVDVKVFALSEDSSIPSYDSLFEGNKTIEELTGTAARCAVQTDVQDYDFYLYVEVNENTLVRVGYKGDSNAIASDMALNVYHLFILA